MKTKTIYFGLIVASLVLLCFTSCKPKNGQEPDPIDSKEMLFHVWVPIESGSGGSGMGGDDYIVHELKDITTGVIDSKGAGKDVSTILNPHVIIKGRNYYTINKEGQFGKYDSHLTLVKKIPMPYLKERKFSHAWLDENILVMAGATGDAMDIQWVKVDTEKMRVIGEGILKLSNKPQEKEKMNSSGMLAYRKKDNKLLYTFEIKADSKASTFPVRHGFFLAFIDPSNMEVIKEVFEDRADFMASTAFGELRQEKSFFDKNGDYYIACNRCLPDASSYTEQYGRLLRVKAGEMDFDKSYNGYPYERGKIVTINDLKNGKALLYMQDPVFATPDNPVWKKNPYVFYWIVLDLATGKYQHLKDIPFSAGNFSQLAVVYRGKAFIGTNAADGSAKIYTYDIATGKVSGGADFAENLKVERIVLLEDKK